METTTTADTSIGSRPHWRALRWVVWGGASFLLLLPLVAMQFTEEVNWGPFDFLVMGIMLGLVCAAFEVTLRVAHSNTYAIAAGIAMATAFLMSWINLAVGIIGDGSHPANLAFFGVLAIGLIAVVFSRLQPLGMARAMQLMAVAQVLVILVALIARSAQGAILSLLVTAAWLVSAALFRKAA
jgi:hypothetical protein